MTDDRVKPILRLPRKHSRHIADEVDPSHAARLIRAQAPRNAVLAALIVIVAFSALWAMLSVALDRVFPWMTMLLGLLVGLAVRRAGRGIDWRFPVIAGVVMLPGVLVANIVVAAAFTASEFGTSTLTVLGRVTTMTWPVFFDEVVTPADVIYAVAGAAIAAFNANRRLQRDEYRALRLWQERNSDG